MTLNLVTGEEGIIAKEINAKNQTTYAIEKEKIQTAIPAAINIESNLELDFEKLENELSQEGEVEVTNRGRYFIVDFKDKGRKYRVNKDDYSVEENYDSTYFGGFWDFSNYKDDIKTVQFVKYINVPEGAVQADLSKANNGSIIGWLEPNEDEPDRYDFYIGSEKTILAQAGSCNSLFRNWDKVEKIYFDNFDTWEVTSIFGIFWNCNSLEEVNADFLVVDNVENMSNAFLGCSAITGKLDLSKWNIDKVSNMSAMFSSTGAKEIIMNGKNSIVSNVNGMFHQSQVEKIDISGLSSSNIKSLNITFWDTPNLRYLDMSNFIFDNVTNWFCFIGGSKTIYVKDMNSKNILLEHLNSSWTDKIIIK